MKLIPHSLSLSKSLLFNLFAVIFIKNVYCSQYGCSQLMRLNQVLSKKVSLNQGLGLLHWESMGYEIALQESRLDPPTSGIHIQITKPFISQHLAVWQNLPQQKTFPLLSMQMNPFGHLTPTHSYKNNYIPRVTVPEISYFVLNLTPTSSV